MPIQKKWAFLLFFLGSRGGYGTSSGRAFAGQTILLHDLSQGLSQKFCVLLGNIGIGVAAVCGQNIHPYARIELLCHQAMFCALVEGYFLAGLPAGCSPYSPDMPGTGLILPT